MARSRNPKEDFSRYKGLCAQNMNRERLLELRRKYNNSAKGKKVKAAYQKRNLHKAKAHVKVYEALKKGLLVKKYCYFCEREPTEAHHEDYTKPLDVIWMCRRCHRAYHKLVGSF